MFFKKRKERREERNKYAELVIASARQDGYMKQLQDFYNMVIEQNFVPVEAEMINGLLSRTDGALDCVQLRLTRCKRAFWFFDTMVFKKRDGVWFIHYEALREKGLL